MTEKTFRLVVFTIVTAGLVALSYLKQDPTHLIAIGTFLLKPPQGD